MTRTPLRQLFALSFLLGIPALVLGCPKKPQPVEFDAGAVPVATVDAAPTVLQPLDEIDAAVDAAEAAAPPKHGTGLTTSQTRAKQCCTALRNQAKAMGNSPEAQQVLSIATVCDGIALGIGPSAGPQAPELEPIRAILRGKPTLPPLCQGL